MFNIGSDVADWAPASEWKESCMTEDPPTCSPNIENWGGAGGSPVFAMARSSCASGMMCGDPSCKILSINRWVFLFYVAARGHGSMKHGGRWEEEGGKAHS